MITDQELREIVEQAGGEYVGIQEGFPEVKLSPLVIFKNRITGTTLGLKVQDVSRETVEDKLNKSNGLFDSIQLLRQKVNEENRFHDRDLIAVLNGILTETEQLKRRRK